MQDSQDTDAEFHRRLGINIRKQRERAKLSIAVLAERTGVSESTISRIEAGADGASISALVRLCSAVGLRGPLDRLTRTTSPEPCTPMTLEAPQTTELIENLCDEFRTLVENFVNENSSYVHDSSGVASDYLLYFRPFVTNLLAGRLPVGSARRIDFEPLVYCEETVARYHARRTPHELKVVHGWSVRVEGQPEFLCAEKMKFVPVSSVTDVFTSPEFAYKALQQALERKRGLPLSTLVIVPLQCVTDGDDDTPLWRESTEGELAEEYVYYPVRRHYSLEPTTE